MGKESEWEIGRKSEWGEKVRGREKVSGSRIEWESGIEREIG